MAKMTEEEADALDELWTKTTPSIRKGEGGFFTERRDRMLVLDETTARLLNAKAMATHQTPAELVATLIRKDLASAI
jgi:hypothetical protein